MTHTEAVMLVKRYLSDCRTFGRLLNPEYHPTEAGALKIIFHRRPDRVVIRDAYREVVSKGNDKRSAE